MDFITIDFETATSDTNSACSIGIAFVENLEIIKTEYYLIQPPTLLFGKKNIELHGILPIDVKDEPKFPVIWDRIRDYFNTSYPIIAHNAQFDMSVLMQCLKYYDLEIPDFSYACSIPISTKVCETGTPRTLEARANHLGIDLVNHHNAEADAITCAKIVIESIKRAKRKTFQAFCNVRHIELKRFSDLKPQKSIGRFSHDRLDYQHAIAPKEPPKTVFTDQKICITGEFDSFSRIELSDLLFNFGGEIVSSVSKNTDYLIAGKQDKKIVGADGLSSKQEKALALIHQGFEIKILNEDEVKSIINEIA